jgi:alkylated DNA repair dioxygenase AlkB
LLPPSLPPGICLRLCEGRSPQTPCRVSARTDELTFFADGPRIRSSTQPDTDARLVGVSQLSLFASCERSLADDERGRITYTPGFVDAVTAQAWFAELRTGVQWRSERREMYDREVEVPRLLGHFRLDPAPDATPAAILEAARRVVAHLRVPFNSVGLNLYRDGRDSVAPHNDHLYDIREGFPIALLSLGATRRMSIRTKAEPRRSSHVDLETGSLLVMDYATQIHYTHGVPKTSEAVDERISLAFRVKPDQQPPKAGSDRGFSRSPRPGETMTG